MFVLAEAVQEAELKAAVTYSLLSETNRRLRRTCSTFELHIFAAVLDLNAMRAVQILYTLWRQLVRRDEREALYVCTRRRWVICRVFMRCSGVSDICITYS